MMFSKDYFGGEPVLNNVGLRGPSCLASTLFSASDSLSCPTVLQHWLAAERSVIVRPNLFRRLPVAHFGTHCAQHQQSASEGVHGRFFACASDFDGTMQH